MSIAIEPPRPAGARVTDSELVVDLEDGRTVSVPLSWYPRLSYATQQEREDFEITREGIHWPQLDEDVSAEMLLAGIKAGESAASLERWHHEMDRRRQAGDRTPWGGEKPLPDWWEDD